MMKKATVLIFFVLLSMPDVVADEKRAKQASQWKAGVATVAITPEQEIWMAGYGGRKKPSDGVVQDLYAKALALEDQSGVRFVFVTMDLIGVLRGVRDSVARKVEEDFKLPPAYLLLNASHTHCGPEYRPRKGREKEAHDLVEHHGRTLAYSVIAAAPVAGVRPVTGGLRAAIEDVELARNNGKPAHNHPVQVARIGDQICLVALGSETTVDYSLRLKREIDCSLVWVSGYSNDYSGYVPSRRVVQEGGYEASNRFTLDVEERTVSKVHELLGRLNADKMDSGRIPGT